MTMWKEFLRLVIGLSLILLITVSSSALSLDENRPQRIVAILVACIGWLLVQIAVAQRFRLSGKELADGTTVVSAALYAFVVPLVLTSMLVGFSMRLEFIAIASGLLHVLLFLINPISWIRFLIHVSHGMSSDSWLDALVGRKASVQVRGLLFHLLGAFCIAYIVWKVWL